MPGPANRSDRELMARVPAGDHEAFTLIYRTHSPEVFRFALYMSGDRMKAVEITQDVFVWLMQHSCNFDPSRGELGAFLIGVTRKFLLRQQQHEQKWVPLDEASEVFEARLSAANAPDMDETAATWLREAIALLPGRYREVVVLCDLEGNTYESAAAMLECAVGTVRSRLHRARELLARKLHSRKEAQRCAV